MEKKEDINRLLKQYFEMPIPAIDSSSLEFGTMMEYYTELLHDSYLNNIGSCNSYIEYNKAKIDEVHKENINNRLYTIGYISGIFFSTVFENHFPKDDAENYSAPDVLDLTNYDLHEYLNETIKMYKLSTYNNDNSEKYHARYYLSKFSEINGNIRCDNHFQLGLFTGSFYRITELLEIEKLSNNDLNHFENTYINVALTDEKEFKKALLNN